MELRQLEYFQMVSRFNNVTKAAEQLHVAQPSVTVAIQKLEEELGVPLFDRSQKQLALTQEGEIFLRRVDDILSRVRDVAREMADYQSGWKGFIRIGVPPMIGVFLFPHIFSKFRKQYPQMEFTITEAGSLAILKQLEQGKLDIGFVAIFTDRSDVKTVPITAGQIMVCLPPNHPLGKLPNVSFAELRDQPFILHKEDTYNRQLILEECRKNHYSPQIIFSTSQIQTIIGMVEEEAGVSFLLDAIARKHSNIISRPLANPLYNQIGLAWSTSHYQSKAAKAFIKFVADSLPFNL